MAITIEVRNNNLEKALKDKNWTAALEQGDSYQEKPPAIILDVDETVLDNSIFQARSILNGTSYPTAVSYTHLTLPTKRIV